MLIDKQAEALARALHAGQYYHGAPREDRYNFVDFHLLPQVAIVEGLGGSAADKATVFLHDAVEDTDATLATLTARGVPSEVVHRVDLFTRRPDQSHQEYMSRLAPHPGVSSLKIVDSGWNLESAFILRRYLRDEDFAASLRKYAGNILFLAPHFLAAGPDQVWYRFVSGEAKRAETTLQKHFGQAAVAHATALPRPAFSS